jgi:hypothetical protein
MQKECCNTIGQYNCLNPQQIYKRFNKIDVYLPSVLSFFTGKNTIKNNDVLLDFLLIGKPAKILKLIGTDYDTLSFKNSWVAAEQMLEELKAGSTLTFKDIKGEDFTVKYTQDKFGIVQGLQMFQNGKKVSDSALSDTEMLNYLIQYTHGTQL